MRIALVAFVLAMAAPLVAFAEEDGPSYSLDFSTGADYSFPHGLAPTFNPTSIDSAVTLGVSLHDWSLSASYFEAADDEEGFGADLGYGVDQGCPVLRAIGCSIGVGFKNIEDVDTVEYSLGVGGALWRYDEAASFKPRWAVDAAAVTGDRSEATLSGGLEFPWEFTENWTLSGQAGVIYGFESDDTQPTWGLSLGYDFNDRVNLTVGYTSLAELDENDEIEVERNATAVLHISF